VLRADIVAVAEFNRNEWGDNWADLRLACLNFHQTRMIGFMSRVAQNDPRSANISVFI
jgi:hypothetical protein